MVKSIEFRRRAKERNRIRKNLGLPPLSADGMKVLGEYRDYWLPEEPLICKECSKALHEPVYIRERAA